MRCRTCPEVHGVGSSLRAGSLLVPCECGGSERPRCPNAALRVGLDGLRGSRSMVTQHPALMSGSAQAVGIGEEANLSPLEAKKTIRG
jgi:hypothetical protein